MKKTIFAAAFFYFLAVFQTSFLAHFDVFGIVPNLIFIFTIALALLESASNKAGYATAFIGGLYTDIFSLRNFGFFGFYIISFYAAVFLIKFFLSNYVRFPKKTRF